MSAIDSPGAEASRKPRQLSLPAAIALPAIGLLVAAHLFVVYKVSAHLTIPAGLLAGVAVVLLVKHLGLFGSIYALYRSRFRRQT